MLYKHGELLYSGVFALIRDWLRSELAKIRPSDSGTLLEVTKKLYDDHKLHMRMIRDIMLYSVSIAAVENATFRFLHPESHLCSRHLPLRSTLYRIFYCFI